MKNSIAYYNIKKKLDFFLSKSTVKYNCCFTWSIKSDQAFYCYSYENASELADYLEKKYNIKRLKTDGLNTINFKYLIITNNDSINIL